MADCYSLDYFKLVRIAITLRVRWPRNSGLNPGTSSNFISCQGIHTSLSLIILIFDGNWRLLSQDLNSRGLKHSKQSNLVPKFRINGVIPLFIHTPSFREKGQFYSYSFYIQGDS